MKTLALFLSLLATTLHAKEAMVNMVDLVRFHPSRERDRKLVKETEKEYREKIDRERERQEELRDLYEKALKDVRNPVLSESARREAEAKALSKRKEMMDADRDLREQIQKCQESLRELENRLLRRTTDEIRRTIASWAKSKDVDWVGDSSQLLWVDDKLDATDDILQMLGVNPDVRKNTLEEEQRNKDKEAAASAEQ